MKKVLLTLWFITSLISESQLVAQPCDPLTPSFNINLTGVPDSIWNSPPTFRYGYCCTANGSDRCVEFNVTLDTAAVGITLDISCGAMPSGALFYQVNCGPQIPIGQPICLSGVGPHRVTFCKPGGNANCFSITSNEKPQMSGNITVTQACLGQIDITGLDTTTITWTSVPFNATYNSYLSCTTGCSTVIVNPGANPPAYIDYMVCGNVIGSCGQVYWCDTARVTFFNTLGVNITPVNPVLCYGPGTITVTANPTGGATPYTYLWSTGQTTQSINVGPGVYTVTVDDSVHCATATATVNVTALPAPIVADAGNDTTICSDQAWVNLHGVVQVATGGIWLGGAGTFNPNNTTLNAIYYPSAAEISSGLAALILETTGNGGCPPGRDTIFILIQPPPVPVISGPNVLCALGSATYSVASLLGHTYNWSVTNGSINGSSTGNSINVSWGTPGPATVTVTQTNQYGCDSTVTMNVTLQPNPGPVIAGSASICRLTAGTYSVPAVAGNTYLWSVTGGSINGSAISNTLNVSWGNFTSGTVTITQTNAFGCDSTVMINVTLNPYPLPIISGPMSVCRLTGATYSVANILGDSYLWTVTGGSINGPLNGSSVNVSWGNSASGTVTLTQTNPFGCDSTVSMNVTLNPYPVPVISGPGSVCRLTAATYSVPVVPGDIYFWSVTGGSINGSPNSNPISVSWGNNPSGTVTVTQTNSLGCDSTVTINITLNPYPVPVIAGNDSVCRLTAATYSLPLAAGNTYLWSVTGGSINGPANANSVSVSWGNTSSGTVTATQTNSFGCDSTVTMNVTLMPYPVPVIAGPNSVCRLTAATYSVPSIPGDTYAWAVTGGSISGSLTGPSVNVSWGNFPSGTISVTQTNSFGCDSTITLNVTLNPYPVPVITGPNSVCRLTSSTYSVPVVAGDIYAWSVVGGSINGSPNANSITVSWGNFPSGTVTVTQINPFGCDSTVTINVTLNPYPVPVITGPASVCQLTGAVYSVTPVGGNTYGWSVTGGSINGPTNTSSINVSWGNTGAGTVTVTQINTFGCDSTVTRNITLNPYPVPVITGPASVCQLSSATYSVTNTAGNTYAWSITGGTINGSSTLNSVTVSWGSSASGIITVTQTNSFGCDSTVSRIITLVPNPTPIISGPNSICRLTAGTYSVPAVPGDTYSWSITGGSINGSSTSDVVSVSWGDFPSGTITITQTNSSGCDSTVSMNVTLNPYPVPVISGPNSVCRLTGATYSVASIAGDTYGWTVTGGSINGAANGSSVNISWGNFASGTITVIQTNAFGCDSTVSMNVTLNPYPVPVITGSNSVCRLTSSTYSVPAVPGDIYAWSVVGGSISGSPNSNSVTVSWGNSASGTITVIQTNSFGCDSTVTMNVTLNPYPVPVITGNNSVCRLTATTYSVTAVAGNTYAWSVTGGSINGSANANTITVSWGNTGFGSVTVTQTNTFGCDSTVTMNITLNPYPLPVISGPASVCQFTSTTYFVTNTPGDTYAWTVTGGSINGSSTSSSITVSWGSSLSGTVTVTQTNSYGCDSTSSRTITLLTSPTPVISGPNSLCRLTAGTYSVPAVAGDTYAWSVTGGSINGPSSSNSVNISWGNFASGTVSVTQTNASGCDSTVSMNVTLQPYPVPVISGPVSICQLTGGTYSVPNVPGDAYAWTVTGGSINGSPSVNSISVSWGASASGTVTVTQMNSFGCDSTVTVNVTLIPPPVPVIAGNNNVCMGSSNTYSVTAAVGNTYNWSVTGGTINGSANSNSVNIIWGMGGSGTITITQTNASGCDSTVSRTITLMPQPTPVINGPASICKLTSGIYSVSPTAGNTYSWSITNGSINGSATSNTITVSWGNYSSGTVTVTETNPMGCDSTITMNVTLNPYPVPVISGSTSVCQLTASTYSVASAPGSTYAWSVTGGSFNGSSTTNSVDISWGTSATGTLTVTQINSFGCDSTVSKTITLVPPPTPVINGSTNVCAGSTTSFTVPSASGNQFAWSVTGGVISGTPNSNAVNVVWGTGSSGTVTVTQTNTSGCDSTVSVNVSIMTLPVVSITAPANSCLDMPSQFSVNLGPGENASWSVTGGSVIGPNNLPMADIAWATGGMHIVTVVITNTSGCSATGNVNAFVELPPNPIISGPSPVCETDTAQYSVAYVPGHMYIWNVSGGSIVSLNISNTIDVQWWSAGTGSVSCNQISPAGCDSLVMKNITINSKPIPTVSGNIFVCEHSIETYYVNASAGSSYTWSATGGVINGPTNSSSASVTWDVSGTGSVTVVEMNSSGCAQYNTMTVTIQTAPSPVINGSITGCVTPITTNYSTPWTVNSSYFWTVTGGSILSGNGSNSVNISWNTIGINTITLTVTNTLSGCDSTVTLNVDVTAIVPPTVQASIYSGCPPLTVMFSGNSAPGQTYQWDFGDNFTSTGSNPTHIFNHSGTFQVMAIATNANGCSDTAYGTIIVRPAPNAAFTHDYITEFLYIPENTLILNNLSTGGTTYMWTFGTGDTSNAFEPPYIYRAPDNYIIHLYVTNQWGCRDSAEQPIRVRVREGIYIPNAFSPNGDNVNEYFFVNGENIANLKMIIFDRWGEVLVETTDKHFKWDGSYKGKICQEGVYIYYITTEGANGTENEYKGTITLVK